MTESTMLRMPESSIGNTAIRPLIEVLNELETDINSLSAHDRSEVARKLWQPVEQGDEVAIRLVYLLATDEQPEVRLAVARLLHLLPDADYGAVLSSLLKDSHAFVQRTARRSEEQRQQVQGRPKMLKQEEFEEVAADLDAMRQLFGSAAADMARRIGEKFAAACIGGVVHDIRHVVSPIKARTNSLRNQLKGTATRSKLDKNLERHEYLDRLLENVRNFTRATLQEDRQPEPLHAMVAEAVSDMTADFQARGKWLDSINLTHDVPDDIMLNVTRHQVVLVLKNLIANAIEALPDASKSPAVAIRARVLGPQVVISVADNGVGIPEEHLRYLRQFVPGRTTKQGQGTGYGLPTSHRYVDGHGGSITIQSEREHGTKVSITLPRERAHHEGVHC